MSKKIKHWLIFVLAGFFISTAAHSQDLLISGGYAYSTAICANGNVFSWGQNNAGTPPLKGTLGTGDLASSNILTPERVLFPTNDPYFSGVLGLPNITIRAVDAGSTLTLMALDCHSGVWTVGMNNNANGVLGQGDGMGAGSTEPARVLRGEYTGVAYDPSLDAYLTNVKSISGGDNMNYVIMEGTGEVMSWGLNANGQLGNGTTTNSTTPVYVRTNSTTTLGNAIQIEAGDKTGYALVDTDGDGIGTVYSWGANTSGELGRSLAGGTNSGTENGTNSNYASEVVFKDGTPLDNIVSISAGDVMCFALDVDGYVWAWGNHGWGGLCGTGPGGVHSDPKRVLAGEWATTAGGTGETYLKARSIAGGQGFGMAVSIDGIPLAWGNNGGNSGFLGNGTTSGNSDIPVIIKTGAGTYDTDAIGISDGDSWGFYTKEDGSLMTWGYNGQGQLGIGNTTNQAYAVPFSLPGGCDIPDPKPFAKLTPRDMEICTGTWTGTLLNSQFSIKGTLQDNYVVTWYHDGGEVSTGNGSNTTYNATALGTYRVVVEYVGSSVPCSTYPDAIDEITLTEAIAPFSAAPGTYCGLNGTFEVNGYAENLTNYDWYTTATSTTKLNATSTNPFTTALTNATMVDATTYRLWVEDPYALDNKAAESTPCTPTNHIALEGNNFATAFTLAETNDVVLESFDVTAWAYGNSTINYQVRIVNDNGANSPDFTSVVWTSATKSLDLTGSQVRQTIPLNYDASGLTAGTKYWIQVTSASQFVVADYTNDCSGNVLPMNDDSGKDILTITNSYRYSTVSTKFPNIYSLHIKRGTAYPCGRIPVDITEDCPPCQKPTSVDLTPATTQTICEGDPINIAAAAVLGTPQNGSYYYTWFKDGVAITTAATTYADYDVLASVLTDAGRYKIRVEDGNVGSAACYLEDSVDFVINAPTVAGVIEDNQTICYGDTPAQLVETTGTTGGVPTDYNYQWQQSADGTTYTDIAGETSDSYSPGALIADTYYKRIDSSGVCPSVETNAVLITVNDSTIAGEIEADQTICSGSTPAPITELTAPTGGLGAATYTHTWEVSTNGGASWTVIAGETGAGYTPGSLTATTMYRRTDASGVCPGVATNEVTITVNPAVVAGEIETDQTICSGSAPAAITNMTYPTGGLGAGTYEYKWYQSADGTTWTEIAGETAEDYTPSSLTATTYFKRIDSSGVCPGVETNVVTITINEPTVAGAIGVDQTICEGTAAAMINSTALPTNGTGTYFYKWEQSADNGTTWTEIAGETGIDLDPGILSTTTIFRRIDSSGVCPGDPSNEVTITVDPQVTEGEIETDQTICSGDAAAAITNKTSPIGGPATGAYTYAWEMSTDGGTTWSPIAGATSDSYTPGALTQTTSYRRVDAKGTCPAKPTASVTVTVNEPVVAGTIDADEELCFGNTASAITETAPATGGLGGTDYAYKWEMSTNSGGTWTTIAGATGTTYSPGSLTQTTMYRRVDSSGACPVVYTNEITKTVNPEITAGTIDGAATVCSGNSTPGPITETVATTGGSGTYTYQWQYSLDGSTGWTDVTGETSVTMNPPASLLTQDIYFRRVDMSGACTPKQTNSVMITVLPGILAGTIADNQTICYNTIPAAITMSSSPSGVTASAVNAWEQSIDGGVTWSAIAGETGNSYTPAAAFTQTTMIRKVVTDPTLPGPCNTASTTPVTITVNPQFVEGSISADATICENEDPAALTGVAPTGGDGNYSYSWEQSTDGGTSWSAASGVNNGVDYDPAALTVTTVYRRVDNDGMGCGGQPTNDVTITVTPNVPVSVTINDPGENCPGVPFNFTATPVNEGSTPIYTWYVDGSIEQSGSSATFTSSTLNQGERVQVELESSEVCKTGSPAGSNTVVIQITPAVTPEINISDPGPICEGETTLFTPTTNGGGPTPTYEWYVNGTMESNASTYSDVFADGDQIYVRMTSSLACATQPDDVSETITLDVRPVPAPLINETDITICSGNSVNLTATTGSGNIKWYKDGVEVASGTNTLSNISISGEFTVSENNGACPEEFSAPITVTVIQTPIADAGPDIYIKEGATGMLKGSGGGVYTWTPATGLSDPYIANPTFTADNSITYTLQVSDPTNTCSTEDVMNVIVEKAIDIPNAITVNGDGNNDDWEIANIEGFPNCTVKVFNRWGDIVWESKGYLNNWDGTNSQNGQLLPDGTYFYVIELNSEVFSEPYSGYIQILK